MIGPLDVVIAGAGVVGLACARALALAGREVVVLEAEPRLGMHTSARSSEVLHAGLSPTPAMPARRWCCARRCMPRASSPRASR